MATDLVYEPSSSLTYHYLRRVGVADHGNPVSVSPETGELVTTAEPYLHCLEQGIFLSPASPGEAWRIQGLTRVLARDITPRQGRVEECPPCTHYKVSTILGRLSV